MSGPLRQNKYSMFSTDQPHVHCPHHWWHYLLSWPRPQLHWTTIECYCDPAFAVILHERFPLPSRQRWVPTGRTFIKGLHASIWQIMRSYGKMSVPLRYIACHPPLIATLTGKDCPHRDDTPGASTDFPSPFKREHSTSTAPKFLDSCLTCRQNYPLACHFSFHPKVQVLHWVQRKIENRFLKWTPQNMALTVLTVHQELQPAMNCRHDTIVPLRILKRPSIHFESPQTEHKSWAAQGGAKSRGFTEASVDRCHHLTDLCNLNRLHTPPTSLPQRSSFKICISPPFAGHGYIPKKCWHHWVKARNFKG